MKKTWIWFWYNDITRLLGIVSGGFTIIILGICNFLGISINANSFSIIYLLFFLWAVIDNDYSNLRKIGMDEYRNKLKGN